MRMNVRKDCWEGLITHNEMRGRGSPKGKKVLLPSDLLRGCILECIRWAGLPFLFFFFSYLPLRGLLSGGSAGAREGTISPYSYPDSILMPKPGPNGQHLLRTALRAPHNACCSGSCILIHPHIGNHCLSHAVERQPFHSNPPSSPPKTQFPYVVVRARERGITHLRRTAIDKTLRIK